MTGSTARPCGAAYHEAGHAVAGLFRGVGLVAVEIQGLSDSDGGRCRYTSAPPVSAILAGYYAEVRGVGQACVVGWSQDRELAALRINSGVGCLRSEMKQARADVDKGWAGIEALAATLQRDLVVPGPEAARIIVEALARQRSSEAMTRAADRLTQGYAAIMQAIERRPLSATA